MCQHESANPVVEQCTKLLSHGDNYKIPDDVHVNEFLIVFEKRILVPEMTPELFFVSYSTQHQGWLTIWHYLFLAGQSSYDLFHTRVADYLALCVFGRSHDGLWGGEGTLESKVMKSKYSLQ
jgi:hypothetical protein